MDPNVWLAAKFDLDLAAHYKCPIELPDCGRDTLAHWFHVWEFFRGAEIGVEQGLYSEVLCRENPNLRLLCVSEGFVVAWPFAPAFVAFIGNMSVLCPSVYIFNRGVCSATSPKS
jgi:hypothetical protein